MNEEHTPPGEHEGEDMEEGAAGPPDDRVPAVDEHYGQDRGAGGMYPFRRGVMSGLRALVHDVAGVVGGVRVIGRGLRHWTRQIIQGLRDLRGEVEAGREEQRRAAVATSAELRLLRGMVSGLVASELTAGAARLAAGAVADVPRAGEGAVGEGVAVAGGGEAAAAADESGRAVAGPGAGGAWYAYVGNGQGVTQVQAVMRVATIGVARNFVSVHDTEGEAREALAAEVERRGGRSAGGT